MSVKEFEAAVHLMAQYPNLNDFSGPRDECIIREAEQLLQVHFPETYRLFLQRYGAGNFGAFEIYGIVQNDFTASGIPDGIWFTREERKSPLFNQDLVVIGEDGMGGLHCIHLRSENPNEQPVVVYEPGIVYGPERAFEVLANDFGSYMLQQVELALALAEDDRVDM